MMYFFLLKLQQTLFGNHKLVDFSKIKRKQKNFTLLAKSLLRQQEEKKNKNNEEKKESSRCASRRMN